MHSELFIDLKPHRSIGARVGNQGLYIYLCENGHSREDVLLCIVCVHTSPFKAPIKNLHLVAHMHPGL